jgi:hypothetical protein
MTEQELSERDDRVREKIVAAMKDYRAELDSLRLQISCLQQGMFEVQSAVESERWWELTGILTAEECATSVRVSYWVDRFSGALSSESI